MALVPDSWIEDWKKKDSNVCKNYRYIYKNPIWDKHMPKGASFCPYFWKSCIIGFLFLKCFLVPLLLLTGLFLKFVGKGIFLKLDKHIRKNSFKLFDIKNHEGMGLLAVVISCMIGALLGALSCLLIEVWIVDIETTYGQSLFWWFVIGIPVALICLGSKVNNDTDRKCKPKNYTYLFMFVSFLIFMNAIWVELIAILSEKWIQFTAYISDTCSFLYGLLPDGSSFYTNVAMWTLVTFFGLYIVGNVLSRLLPKRAESEPEKMKIQDPAHVKKEFTRKVFHAVRGKRRNHDLLSEKILEKYDCQFDVKSKLIFDLVFVKCMIETVEEIVEKNPIKYDDFESYDMKHLSWFDGANYGSDSGKDYSNSKACAYYSNLIHDGHCKEKSVKDFDKIFREKINEALKDKTTIESSIEQDLAIAERRVKRKERMDAMCAKCSMMLSILFIPVKFLLTIMKYTWVIMKSKKQGFCPYFYFEAEDEPETVEAEEAEVGRDEAEKEEEKAEKEEEKAEEEVVEEPKEEK
jgi:hypothetical protein